MHLQFYLAFLALVARPIASQVAFIYPKAFVSTTNYSTNEVMFVGDFKVIQWANVSNPKGSRISVTMWQLHGDQFFGSSEYITQNAAADTLSAVWVVNTAKNLTDLPMFYMNLFLEGQTTSLVNSHYFNITSRSSTSTMSTSTISSSTSATSSATSSTTNSQTSTLAALPTTTPVIASSPSLSIGAKVGIAIGVVGAAILGVLAGWLVLGRRRNASPVESQAHPPVQISHYDPVKMEPQPQSQQYPYEVSSGETPPVRHELSP